MNQLMKSDKNKSVSKNSNKIAVHIKQQTGRGKSKFFAGFIKKQLITICIVSFIIMTTICIFLYSGAIKTGAEALKKQYRTAYENNRGSTYDSFERSAYNLAKKYYDVSSEVEISVSELEEVANLEVLDAFATAHIVQNRDKSNGNVTLWLEVNGKGTFVVNLKAAEFIIDNVRHHVSVRVPYPELTDITEINRKLELFEDDFWNGSFKDGVDMVIAEGEKGRLQIEKALITNQEIYENAKKAAQNIISNLVKQINPNVSDLSVDVSFFDLGDSDLM